MSISRRIRSGIVLLAVPGALGYAVPKPAEPTAVFYAVHLDHANYRSRLADPTCQSQCRALTNALHDELGALLRTRFGYVNWTRVGTPYDTVEIRVVPDPERADLLGTDLTFEMRSSKPGVVPRRHRLDFEDWRHVNERTTRTNGWTPARMHAEWAPRLAQALLNGDLREAIFYELPVDAQVTFGTAVPASMRVSYAAIGYGVEAPPPTFRARVSIFDPPPTDTRSSATIHINGCVTASDSLGYQCQVSAIRYPGRDVTGTEISALLGRATITVTSIHLNDAPIPSPDSLVRASPSFPRNP